MDKSRVCITRTINLSKPTAKCQKKANLLVYEKKACEPECPKIDIYGVAPISKITAKRIRVCTGAELKKMCAPKICGCEVEERKRRNFIASILGLGAKGLLAAALIYGSYECGLWGTGEDTEKLYMDMCDTAAPLMYPECKRKPCPDAYKQEDPETEKYCRIQRSLSCSILDKPHKPCCNNPPSIARGMYSIAENWNKFVITLFDVIVNLPEKLSNLFSSMTSSGPPPEPKKPPTPPSVCARKTNTA